MKDRPISNMAASVRQRLLNLAKERREDFTLVLSRYASERLLYRLSVSPWSERFLLKGALLFQIWDDTPHRPTRDIDLLGYGNPDPEAMATLFRQLCEADVVDDGMRFLADTVTAGPIGGDKVYQGVRILLQGRLENARITAQIDIGFGDAVTPDPEFTIFPTLLDFPAPKLRAYPIYTVTAEKYHAIVHLGIGNSRMKDYFDLLSIASHQKLDGQLLARAIEATFARRATPRPVNCPLGLTVEFAAYPIKLSQWNAFLRKNGLRPIPFEDVIGTLAAFLLPFYGPPREQVRNTIWPPGGPWSFDEH